MNIKCAIEYAIWDRLDEDYPKLGELLRFKAFDELLKFVDKIEDEILIEFPHDVIKRAAKADKLDDVGWKIYTARVRKKIKELPEETFDELFKIKEYFEILGIKNNK